MNSAEIKDKLKTVESEQLFRWFLFTHNNWNPLDYELCETYELAKEEIVKRMKKGE